jgi:ubiquinone/menaquinone biosynthesis C-methylase UbiE
MAGHVCPWWGGYFIDNFLRRWLHNPEKILGPYVQPGMSVMDFGCGMGMFSIALARLVGDRGRVIAVDLQQKMLDVLMKRASAAGVADRITAHRCERTSIGSSESVDFALACYSAHEVPDLQRLLGELHSCVRPAGRLLVVEPKGHVTARRFQSMLVWAEEIGWVVQARPHICVSHSVVLGKP